MGHSQLMQLMGLLVLAQLVATYDNASASITAIYTEHGGAFIKHGPLFDAASAVNSTAALPSQHVVVGMVAYPAVNGGLRGLSLTTRGPGGPQVGPLHCCSVSHTARLGGSAGCSSCSFDL
jgi:hypothetical protein